MLYIFLLAGGIAAGRGISHNLGLARGSQRDLPNLIMFSFAGVILILIAAFY